MFGDIFRITLVRMDLSYPCRLFSFLFAILGTLALSYQGILSGVIRGTIRCRILTRLTYLRALSADDVEATTAVVVRQLRKS